MIILRVFFLFIESTRKFFIWTFDTSNPEIPGKQKPGFIFRDINLKVKKGEIFGLLGPNGAGKTTLVSILPTLIQPTSGFARILGHNILEEIWLVKQNIGLMFGSEMIYRYLFQMVQVQLQNSGAR